MSLAKAFRACAGRPYRNAAGTRRVAAQASAQRVAIGARHRYPAPRRLRIRVEREQLARELPCEQSHAVAALGAPGDGGDVRPDQRIAADLAGLLAVEHAPDRGELDLLAAILD